ELSDWMDWHQLGKRFEHLGLAAFWAEVQKARPPREQLADVFLKSALTGWLQHVFKDEPALGSFRREDHETVVEEFCQLDRQLLHVNAQRVASAVGDRRPWVVTDPPGVSHLSDADHMQFDLVILDGASQMLTEDAIGAILRAKQVIICGDSQQLPPTADSQD